MSGSWSQIKIRLCLELGMLIKPCEAEERQLTLAMVVVLAAV